MNLTRRQRKRARKNAVNAALYCVRRRAGIHYTQAAEPRWRAIRGRYRPKHGDYPRNTDCSGFTTWCLLVGLLNVKRHPRDVVNGANWTGGYTGTQLAHGKRVRGRWLPGDLILYRGHVAIYIGGGKVVSHGSEPGPMILPWNYRRDVVSVRRYI